jgi:hypothetical protein
MQVALLTAACLFSACGRQSISDRYSALDRLPDWTGTWANEQASTKAGLQDCCFGNGEHVPFTPRYAEWRKRVGQGEVVNPGGSNLNNIAQCIPAGVPGVMAHPILVEFLFSPGRVTMIFNDGEIRKVDTSGASHPPGDDIEIGFSGHSTGRWEKGALQVETIAIDPRADIFMSNGMKVTPQTVVLEHFELEGPQRLRVDTTITDPEIFATAFRYTRYFTRVPGEFTPGCAVNNIDNGQIITDPGQLP